MTKDEIRELAQQAGFMWGYMKEEGLVDGMIAFAKLVAEHEEKRLTDAAIKATVIAIETAMALEREACANLCIELAPSNKTMTAYKVLHEASKAIQLRGQA
jgi:hypothetical protein